MKNFLILSNFGKPIVNSKIIIEYSNMQRHEHTDNIGAKTPFELENTKGIDVQKVWVVDANQQEVEVRVNGEVKKIDVFVPKPGSPPEIKQINYRSIKYSIDNSDFIAGIQIQDNNFPC